MFLVCGLTLQGRAETWLDLVSPILKPAEKKAYLALPPAGRTEFESGFWSGKSITADEYYRRLRYVDGKFGSTKPASGANTDPGRVYLSLGAPARITRLASSRIFVPMEIWYYDAVPGILNTELRLIFYQPNSIGLPRLYSPVADTIRALLVPQSSAKGMFGPNDNVTESDIRRRMTVGPVEDEVITAASGVASGITYSGNEEILGRIASPEIMIGKAPESRVTSRFIVSRPPLDIVQTSSVYGGVQVDFRLSTIARNEVDLEIIDSAVTVYRNQVHLRFPKPESIEYTHRLDLLPGSYKAVFTVDGTPFPYTLQVAVQKGMTAIFRASETTDVERRSTPFEFDGRQFTPDPDGKIAAVALAQPGKVKWMLRRGSEVVWRAESDGQQISMAELPKAGIAPGTYRLEAICGADSRGTEYVVRDGVPRQGQAAYVSFNANLDPARRHAFIGHQQLLRGELSRARESLARSITLGSTEEAQIELARADALAGDFDAGRARLRTVLRKHPESFEALSVFAYVESCLQDYPVAAEMYRRALAVQESPALRAALAKLPSPGLSIDK